MSKSMRIQDKFLLSAEEAAAYFNIGIKQIRRIAENHKNSLAILNGNRFLIIRSRFEEYILSGMQEEEGGDEP